MFYSSFRINLQIKSSEQETSRPHSVRAGEFPGHLISISSDDVKNDLFLSEIIAEVINLFTIVFLLHSVCKGGSKPGQNKHKYFNNNIHFLLRHQVNLDCSQK